MINASIHGVGNVARLLNKTLPDEMQKELSTAVKNEAQQLYSAAAAAAPEKTGLLRTELKIKYSGKGLIARIGVLQSADRGYIARFLEFGTKAHRITPKNHRALAFSGKYSEAADNPGIKPRRWLLGLTAGARARFQESLRAAMAEALRKVNGS